MNQVELIGRLTKDPELRKTNNGMSILKFVLAVDRQSKDKGTDFINCTAFNQSAEFLTNYANKGNRVATVGHIQTGSYDRDGQKVYTTDVICDRVEILETRNTQNTAVNQAWRNENASEDISISGDELPF